MNSSSNSKNPTLSSLTGRGKVGDDVLPAPSLRRDSEEVKPTPIRILLADSEAVFRVGTVKILAVESDLEVVAQTESLPETLDALATTTTDVVLFGSSLSPRPAETVSEIMRRAPPKAKLVVVT